MNTHRFVTRIGGIIPKTLALMSIIALSTAALSAATTSYLIDTGGAGLTTYDGTPYTVGENTHDFGTADNYLSLTVPILGLASPSVSFGPGNTLSLAFTSDVSSYNIGDKLEQSFLLFNNHGSGNPVGFTLGGFNTTDSIKIEFVSSQNQVVTLTIGAQNVASGNTVTGTAPNLQGNWVSIDGLTGSSSYAGQFSVVAGEGSIAAMRITVTSSASPVPEPSTYAALVGLATLGFAALRRRR